MSLRLSTRTTVLALGLTALLASSANAAVVISTHFISSGSNDNLPGTQIGLDVNLPGSNWLKGAGWSWGTPHVMATWMGGTVQNAAYLDEENTALGVSIASAGSYTKPTALTVASDLMFDGGFAGNAFGLGFWSTFPSPNVGNATDNFSGIRVAKTGSAQLYENGSAVGSPVALSALLEGVFYNLSFDVDTTTGTISNAVFAGNPLAFTSTAFTDAATAYAGPFSTSGSRTIVGNVVVSEAAPAITPEPASLALLALGGIGLLAPAG